MNRVRAREAVSWPCDHERATIHDSGVYTPGRLRCRKCGHFLVSVNDKLITEGSYEVALALEELERAGLRGRGGDAGHG